MLKTLLYYEIYRRDVPKITIEYLTFLHYLITSLDTYTRPTYLRLLLKNLDGELKVHFMTLHFTGVLPR